MKKTLYFISALLLAVGMLLQSCGEKIEPQITPVTPVKPEETQVKTHTMSVVAVKSEIGTKALSLTGGTISATWKTGDKVTVFNKTRNTDLGFLEAQGDGASTTLKGTLNGIVEANDALTLKFLDSKYSEQDGTLAYIAAYCDCSTAEVTVKSATGGTVTATGTATFSQHQAIVEFTLEESDGTAISSGVKSCTVVAGGTSIKVAPGAATNVLFVAVPAFDKGAINLSVVDPNGAPRSYAEAGVSLENGKYYRFGVKMDCIVKNDSELLAANSSKVPKIVLGADIKLSGPDHVVISGSTTIEMSGHSIAGYKADNVPASRIFFVDQGKSLTLNGPGTLKDGHADEGGAIYNRGTLVLNDITFTGCSAHRGGAIYNEGTLCMQGAIVANDNTGDDNLPDNVFLASGKLITVQGAFTEGALIGVKLGDGAGCFTTGYSAHNGSLDPAMVFVPDDAACHLSLQDGEAGLAPGRYYNVTEERKYASLSVLLEATGRDLSEAEDLLPMLFPEPESSATAISYTYRSADPLGYPVELSAVLFLPDAALYEKKGLTGICLANHGTFSANAECPTMCAQFEEALAWRNFGIVMPDYYGLGVTADRPQIFMDSEAAARENIDAYLAAVQLMNDLKVKVPGKVYSFGYSQGGFNSMANLKYVANHPELNVSFDKVLCGGSPFNVVMTWDAYTSGLFRNAIAFVPMTVIGINETRKLGFGYDEFFKGSLLTNWQEWFLSKKYTTSDMDTLLGTNDVSEIMSDTFMSKTGDAYNAIIDNCRRFSLTSGWVPPAGTKILLFHSRQDDTVPFDNFTEMKAFLDEVAPGCYTAYEGDYGGHISAIPRFLVSTLSVWR